MNSDPSGPEITSDETTTGCDELDFARNLFQARSYKCTFCKRGFSNAQALGGHMNIHRKDRAKLNESSPENLLSLDITKSTTYCSEDSPPQDSSTREKLISLENHSTDDHVHDTVPLVKEASIPLFAEAPISLKSGDQEEASASHFDKQVENRKVDHELSYGDELDLELRLGPEPQSANSKPV